MRRERRGSGEVVEREVAIGDGVDRVGRDAVEPERRGDLRAVGREVDARQRTRPERQDAARRDDRIEAISVSQQHPDVGQQVVAEVHRLRALQVRVAGHRPVEVALGAREQHLDQRDDPAARLLGGLTHEHHDIGRDLVVARAGRVKLAADTADERREAPLDRHVDVLIVGLEDEAAAAELLGDLVQPAGQLLRLAGVEHADRGEHRRVRARLLDVVAPQPPVEVDRRVDRLEVGILGLREARHRRR